MFKRAIKSNSSVNNSSLSYLKSVFKYILSLSITAVLKSNGSLLEGISKLKSFSVKSISLGFCSDSNHSTIFSLLTESNKLSSSTEYQVKYKLYNLILT